MRVLNNSAWGEYPYPAVKEYSYHTSLKEKIPELYESATSLLGAAHANMQAVDTFNKSYSNLNSLWQAQRAAEKQFISNYLKIDLNFNNENEITSLMKAFSIFQDRSILEDSLNRIKALEKGEEDTKYKGKETAIYYLLNDTLPSAINKAAKEFVSTLQEDGEVGMDVIEKMSISISQKLSEEISYRLATGYVTEDENLYKDFLARLEEMQMKEDLVRRIFEGYGLTADKLYSAFENQSKDKKNQKLSQKEILSSITKNVQKQAGNVFEIIASTVLNQMGNAISNAANNEFKFTVTETGQLNYMKADQIVFVGNIDIDVEKLQEEYKSIVRQVSQETKSRRKQNIVALSNMLERVREAASAVIEISDKNYKLTGESLGNGKNSGGFAAESPNLNSLSTILSNGQITSDQLDDLIFILANTGKQLINTEGTEDVMKIIALNIASFLFDDITITDALDDIRSTPTVIHLFNLDGIMVPLSVFLEAAYVAFSQNALEYENYVKVHFTPGGNKEPNYPKDGLTMSDWEEFYNDKLQNSKVTIHFFGDFINFIKQHSPF